MNSCRRVDWVWVSDGKGRGLSVSDSFERIGVCCFFLLLFSFAYGFVRIHARTWDMRKRRIEERNENKDQRKKKQKFKVQSICDGNAIQWYSCWGRKREQQYDKPKIILFILPFISLSFLFESCQRWVKPSRSTLWLSLSLSPSCCAVLCLSTILFFFCMNLDFYSLFVFSLPRFLK